MEIYVLIWFCCGIIASMIAKNKGNDGCGGFILGLILGPIGIIIALAMGTNVEGQQRISGNTKKCPFCGELIKPEAIICKHCRSTVKSEDEDENPNNKPTPKKCPSCSYLNKPAAKVCFNCGYKLSNGFDIEKFRK